MDKICKGCKSANPLFKLDDKLHIDSIIYVCKSLKRKRQLVADAVAKGIEAPSPDKMKLPFGTEKVTTECAYFKASTT